MLPKKKQCIQEIAEESVETQPEFLQEIVEPEIQVPEEPQTLMEKAKTVITPRKKKKTTKKK